MSMQTPPDIHTTVVDGIAHDLASSFAGFMIILLKIVHHVDGHLTLVLLSRNSRCLDLIELKLIPTMMHAGAPKQRRLRAEDGLSLMDVSMSNIDIKCNISCSNH